MSIPKKIPVNSHKMIFSVRGNSKILATTCEGIKGKIKYVPNITDIKPGKMDFINVGKPKLVGISVVILKHQLIFNT